MMRTSCGFGFTEPTANIEKLASSVRLMSSPSAVSATSTCGAARAPAASALTILSSAARVWLRARPALSLVVRFRLSSPAAVVWRDGLAAMIWRSSAASRRRPWRGASTGFGPGRFVGRAIVLDALVHIADAARAAVERIAEVDGACPACPSFRGARCGAGAGDLVERRHRIIEERGLALRTRPSRSATAAPRQSRPCPALVVGLLALSLPGLLADRAAPYARDWSR